MIQSVKIVTVYIENEAASCECVCPIPDIGAGDFVQIFLNNAPVVGEVISIKEVQINDLPNSIYDMKSVIRKVPNPNKDSKIVHNTIRVNDFVPSNRTVTLVGRGVLGHFDFSGAELDAHNAQAGDTIYFSESDGTRYAATILKISDTASTYEPGIRVNAVLKNEKNKEFLKNKIKTDLKSENKKAVLQSFKLPYEEYSIEGMITHIGERAFERTRVLKKLIIATDGIVIEPLAFAYNNSIEEIHIADERTVISVNSFDGCTNLRRVTLPYTLYYLRFELAEYYGNRIEFIYYLGSNQLIDGIVYSSKMSTVICCIDENITEYIAPIHVSAVREKAFLNCKKLRLFVASPIMEKPGYGILAGCTALKDVHAHFEDDYDVILMFGTDYCDGSIAEPVNYKDGTTRMFYLPSDCRYHNLSKTDALLKEADPKDLSPMVCHYLGEYFSDKHNPKEAIRFHAIAARQGVDKSYQRLAAYSQIEDIGREYFTVDLYDFAHRLLTVKPFFHMLAVECPEYQYVDMNDQEILDQFMNPERLRKLLEDVADSNIFDTDLLSIGLNKIYLYTEDVHDLTIKRMFLRCIQKIGLFDSVVDWKEELLEALFDNGDEEDFREFAFEIIKMESYLDDPEKEAFLREMPDTETRDCLIQAHMASMHPRQENVSVFEDFLRKYDESGDSFYQKCAVVSIFSYICLCWREKKMKAQFRTVLELVKNKYDAGYVLLGKMVLDFKQNLKRNIPKQYYYLCAEKMFQAGLLHSSTFDNIIGKNGQEQAAFYCRYPEYFNPGNKDTFVMKEFNSSWVYIPGTMIMKPESSKKEPIMHMHYRPELIDGELMLFLNPHEGISYMQKNGLPIPEDFFRIPLGQVLSVMSHYNVSEATVFPRIVNKKITQQYIKSIYDWR